MEQLGTTSPPSLWNLPKEKQPTTDPTVDCHHRRAKNDAMPSGLSFTPWMRISMNVWTFKRWNVTWTQEMCSNGSWWSWWMEENKVFLFIYIVRCHFQETLENREPRYHMTKNPLEKYTMNWITRSIILEEAEVYLAMMPCVSLKRPKNGPQCSPVTRAEPPCHGDKDRWMLEGEGYCGYGGWNSGIKWLTWHLVKPGWNMTSS